jgi:hypothetical protein
MAHGILERLRYPNAVIEQVCRLIATHMFLYTEDWRDASVRRFIIRVGEENLSDVYSLRRADSYAINGVPLRPDFLLPLIERVDSILAQSGALSLKDLRINGSDLLSLGIPSGKRIGAILNELLETVIEDPSLNTRETLLSLSSNPPTIYP